MIIINELKIFVDYLLNKEQSGGSMSPDEFNLLAKRSVDDLVRWYIGLEAEYEPKRPFPSLSIEATQKMKENLAYLKNPVVLTVDSRGNVTLPGDYNHKTSLSYTKRVNDNCGGFTEELVPIEVVDDDKWAGRSSARIKKPTLDYPIANFNKKLSIKVLPINLGSVNLTYIKCIDDPYWNYKLDETSDTEIYEAHGSRDIDLPKILLNDLARLILSYVGINLREAQVIEYAELIKSKGV